MERSFSGRLFLVLKTHIYVLLLLKKKICVCRYFGFCEFSLPKAKEKHDELNYKIGQKKAQSEKMKLFIKALKNRDEVITEFDDALWGSLVDFITIGKKERTVTFKDGTVVEI